MIIGEWKVQIAEDGPTLVKKIWIYRRMPGGISVLGPDMQTETRYDEYSDVPVTMKLDHFLFQAFGDALTGNFKPSEGKFNEGKLEATEKHLEDMRRLVFEEEKIINIEKQSCTHTKDENI